LDAQPPHEVSSVSRKISSFVITRIVADPRSKRLNRQPSERPVQSVAVTRSTSSLFALRVMDLF
jgi:hypothetical protein